MQLRFDRGTLLCTDAPASAALASLPDVLWDPRVRAFDLFIGGLSGAAIGDEATGAVPRLSPSPTANEGAGTTAAVEASRP